MFHGHLLSPEWADLTIPYLAVVDVTRTSMTDPIGWDGVSFFPLARTAHQINDFALVYGLCIVDANKRGMTPPKGILAFSRAVETVVGGS